MLDILLLLGALAGLWLGAELVISGSLYIADRYRISELFIGLTVLAFGTDLPELFVVISGAFDKLGGTNTSQLILGETVGTSMGQIALVAGIIGLFATLAAKRKTLYRDGICLIGTILLLFLLGLDGELSRADGGVLIGVYAIYFLVLIGKERVHEKFFQPNGERNLWAYLSLLGGFVLLVYSSDLTVEQSLAISSSFGISEGFVGVLIVGLGTSLPELITSFTALKKRAEHMAVGNIIGSTIFDLSFVLGAGTVISGFDFGQNYLTFDLPFLFITSSLVIFFLFTDLRWRKWESIGLIILYLTYAALSVGREVTLLGL